MPHESFEKFLEQLAGFNKDESDITTHEKFGKKSKSKRYQELRDLSEATKHPVAKLDLHGQTVEKSEKLVLDFCAWHAANTPGATVVIITGASGKMRQLFPIWANTFIKSHISGFKLKKCGGAWEVKIKRHKSYVIP